MRIVIEGVHFGAQTSCSQAEQPASGTHVEERLAGQAEGQHGGERSLRLADPILVENLKKTGPIFAESEAISGGDFTGVLDDRARFPPVHIEKYNSGGTPRAVENT